MKLTLLLAVALILAGCATPAPRTIPPGPPPESFYWTADRASIEANLLATARDRFGEPAVRRALAAPAYLFAKFYHGMMPPPEPGAAPYRPPMALLVRDNGKWLAATATGFHPTAPDKAAPIEAMLADRAFWSTPASGGPRCTDAGASLLMVKIPGRAETVRTGTCGETEPNERLVLLALEA